MRPASDDDGPAGKAAATFADLLRSYRLRAGLTQEELAERARLSPRAISDLERGKRRMPHAETVALLAAALGLTHEERSALQDAVPGRRGPQQRTSSVAGGDLPPELTPLVGREREEAAVVHLIYKEGKRLVTLTGPGGVGKTRLALRVAATLRDAFEDGVWFVSLAAIRDQRLVAGEIARVLGVLPMTQRPSDAAVTAYVANRHALLLLDNLEQLTEATPFIATLHASCPHLVLLITSRSPLRLQGEQGFVVPPLWVPEEGQLTVGDAERSPAITLFLQRARGVRPGFALEASTVQDVAAICRRLDGIPLAIELAAARVKALSPQGILARLETHVDVLTDGAFDAPARHRTMRDTIAWSYGLLDRGQQALFRQLAVFVGSFDLRGMEAVTGEIDALAAVSALIDQSLVATHGQDRFRLLETVRAYALDRLEAAGENQAVRARHAAHYLALAEEAEPRLAGPDEGRWNERLEVELDNIRAALVWSEESGEVEVGLRILSAIWRSWMAGGHVAEGRDWIRRLLAGAQPQPISPRLRARALFADGVLTYTAGDYAAARNTLQQCLQIWRDTGATEAGIPAALNVLGMLAIEHGEYDTAVIYLDECIEIHRSLDDAFGLGASLTNRAIIARYRGEYRLAEELYEEALHLYRSIGANSAAGIALGELAAVTRELGENDQALDYAEQAVTLLHRTGSLHSLALAYLSLGDAARAIGDRATERGAYQRGLELFQEVGDRGGIADAQLGRARIELDDGNRDEARALCHEALDVYRAMESRRSMVETLFLLGDIDHAGNRIERARRRYTAAMDLARDLRYPFGEIGSLERLAHLAFLDSNGPESARLFAEAAQLRAAIGAPMSPRERATYEQDLRVVGVSGPQV